MKGTNTIKLSDKIKRFCEEYVIDFNGAQAAIRAGYSRKAAKEQASLLLTKANVQTYLSELKAQSAEKHGITKDMLINELSKIAFFDIRRIFTVDGGLKNVHDFGDDEAHAVAGIESYDVKEPESGMILGTTQKVKILNKIQSIERLSKMLGFDAPEMSQVETTINWKEEKTYEAQP